MIINRDYYLNKLIKKKENRKIKIITGIRRVGKSYLLNNLYYKYLIENSVFKEQIIFINLDEASNIKYRNPLYLMEYLNSKINKNVMNYIFIDEIKFVEKIKNPYLDTKNSYVGFYEVLNELLNMEYVDVYVTGSNSKMLSSDVLTEFRGRGDQIHVMPLSFKEFYDFKGGSFEESYDEYQTFGGLPYVLLLDEKEEKIEYLKSLFKETYLKDIIERHNIINVLEINELINILASSIGSFTNPNKIENTFKSLLKLTYNSQTITNHIFFLKDAFLINDALKFDIKGRKYISANIKYYFTDIGIRNAKLEFRQQEPTHLLENIIYNQLKLLGYNIDVGMIQINEKIEDTYKRKQLEVDFVINKGSNKMYIQSVYNMDESFKEKREKKSLLNISDYFKKVIIVRGDFPSWYDENGILILSLKEFLLNYDSLDK